MESAADMGNKNKYIDCISVAAMRESDARTIRGGVPGITLMYRAALGVYRAVAWHGTTVIVVGSGNNGGDGYALACILQENGCACRIVTLSDSRSADGAYYARRAEQLGVPVSRYVPGELRDADIIVDCLLGTGFHGPVRESYAQAIREINASRAFVVSVDINSGMNGDTGEAEIAVHSDLTVTIGFVKTGLVSENAGRYMKRLIRADIGIELDRKEKRILTDGDGAAAEDVLPCPVWLEPEPIDVHDMDGGFMRSSPADRQIQMVFFDLDGTLLPMDMEEFIDGYFGLLAVKAAPYGYESKKLIKGIWRGMAAMVGNNGGCRNEDAFWNAFAGFFGENALQDKAMFEDFYANEFRQAQQFCGFEPKAAETVSWVKKQGVRVALATNPLYPAVATESRIRWAGLEPEDFEFYTNYENIGYCKPNPAYYREIMRIADLTPEACVMVGNDVGEDMIAAELGMRVFLLTDWLVNKDGADISRYPHGSFDDLKEYLLPLL